MLDLLPEFLELSASRARLDAEFNISETWLSDAGQFMLQGALEGVLCFGRSLKEVVEEAFAWGFIPPSSPSVGESGRMDGENGAGEEEWDGEGLVNEIFQADCSDHEDSGGEEAQQRPSQEIEEWESVRRSYVEKVNSLQATFALLVGTRMAHKFHSFSLARTRIF